MRLKKTKKFGIKVPTVVYVEREFLARDMKHAQELFNDDELGDFTVYEEEHFFETTRLLSKGFISSPNEPMLEEAIITEVDEV